MPPGPAARVGDNHVCPKVYPGGSPHTGGPIVTGCSTVLIDSSKAARLGDAAECAAPKGGKGSKSSKGSKGKGPKGPAQDRIVLGSATVFIGGKSAARLSDPTFHGGFIAEGCPTVLIGG